MMISLPEPVLLRPPAPLTSELISTVGALVPAVMPPLVERVPPVSV